VRTHVNYSFRANFVAISRVRFAGGWIPQFSDFLAGFLVGDSFVMQIMSVLMLTGMAFRAVTIHQKAAPPATVCFARSSGFTLHCRRLFMLLSSKLSVEFQQNLNLKNPLGAFSAACS